MKKLILIALTCTAIVMSNCTPSPSPGPATPTPTPTPTPTYSMTATETALVGDWIWDSTVRYYSGVAGIRWNNTHVDVLGQHDEFYNSHFNLRTSYNSTYDVNFSFLGYHSYNVDCYYPMGTSATGYWCISTSPGYNGFVNISGGMTYSGQGAIGGYINTLNTSTLILQSWALGNIATGTKYFLHK